MTESIQSHRRGVVLVAAAAICWSTGGLIARFISTDVWTQVCWRGAFSAACLLVFLLWRDGRQTWQLFRRQGLPGLAVALCFAAASISFVIAVRVVIVSSACRRPSPSASPATRLLRRVSRR